MCSLVTSKNVSWPRLILPTLIGIRSWAFQRTHYWTSKIQDGWDPPSWKSTWRHFFSAEGCPIWIKFRRLVQNDMSTAVMWSKSKPDVEFQYGVRFGQIQRHVIPEPPATLQGATTWQIQCHDSRATYHIAGCCHLVNSLSRFQSHMPHCSHLAKSMSWSCHIAGCKNSICHIKNHFSPYLIFLFLMHFNCQ